MRDGARGHGPPPLGGGQTFAKVFPKVAVWSRKAEIRAEFAHPLEPEPEPMRYCDEDEAPDWIEKARLKQVARVAASEAAIDAMYTAKLKPKSKSYSKAISQPLAVPVPSKLPMVLTVIGALVFAVVLGLNGKQIIALVSPAVVPAQTSTPPILTLDGEDVL